VSGGSGDQLWWWRGVLPDVQRADGCRRGWEVFSTPPGLLNDQS
jgi:hypothetical protein